jgi:hypothetical protein
MEGAGRFLILMVREGAEASRIDVERLVTLLRPYVREDVNRVEAAAVIVKAYEAEP